MTVLLPGLPRCETDVLVAAAEQVGAQVRRVPPAGIPHVPEPAVARADRRDGGTQLSGERSWLVSTSATCCLLSCSFHGNATNVNLSSPQVLVFLIGHGNGLI